MVQRRKSRSNRCISQEQQRVLGFIPNFYVNYDAANAVPLTTKLKFKLAMRVARDPISILGVAFMSGIDQASNRPDYVQGAKGYGQRFGANAAGAFSDILLGGAVLPSLLHQDPRYFYQGTGTTASRLKHAVSHPSSAEATTATDRSTSRAWEELWERRRCRWRIIPARIAGAEICIHAFGINDSRTRICSHRAGIYHSPLHAQSEAIEVGANCSTSGITPDLNGQERRRDPSFLSPVDARKSRPGLPIWMCADRPRVPAGIVGDLRSVWTYWPMGEAGADRTLRTGHRRLSHNLIGVRQRRTLIEGTMVVETQDDQIPIVLAGEIENGRRGLAGHHVIADGKPRLASGESIETAAISFHSRVAVGVIRRADVQDVDWRHAMALPRIEHMAMRRWTGGKIGCEEHVLQCKLAGSATRPRPDREHRARNAMEDLLCN